MSNVLIISPDRISESMSGPGVRYWNFALELSKSHKVTLMVKNRDHLESDSFTTLYSESLKGKLRDFFKSFDVIVVQGLILLDYPILKTLNVPLVIDLYDPFIFEILAQDNGADLSFQLYGQQLQILLEQIRYGDYFICASEKQRDFWIGLLAGSLRINPLTFKKDPSLNSLIGIVPFGLPDVLPTKQRNVMKGVIKGINEEDKVVIWWGGLWDWLDPKTLVRAMELVQKKNKSIKCVIVGVKHPDPGFIPHKVVKEVQELSRELNLTDKTVFFLDWVKYDDRMNFLLEADAGISLHYNNVETRYSFRTRILDYLWSELPMVVTKGDILAELVYKYELGAVVDELDEQSLSDKIILIMEAGEIKKNFKEVREKYYWSDTVKDLNEFCTHPVLSVDKKYLSSFKPINSPNKVNIYISKGMKLLLKGDLKSLVLKTKQKILRRK